MADDGALVLVFDDGYATDDEQIRPVLEDAGVPACLAIVPSWLDGREFLTTERLHALVDDGWEVAAHGSQHRYLQAHRLARDAHPGDERVFLASDHVFPESEHGVMAGDEFEVTDGEGRHASDLAGKGMEDEPYVDLETPLDGTFAADESVLRPTTDVIEDEIVGVREAFAALDLDPSTFVFPYDASDVRAWTTARQHYDALPDTAVRSLPNPSGTSLANLRRYYMETDNMTRVEIADYLDEVAKNDGLGVLSGHSAWDTVPPERVAWTVEAAIERGIEVTTFERLLGN